MLLRWFPWRFVVTRLARAYGFLDPVHLLTRLRGFGHPSEVAAPVELLRAGMLFHARGVINTRAIQNNLDWIWPYWVERQFNPADESFIPRAFSFSHINLTHRNWTAVGWPDIPFYPIVDPRGLVTAMHDGWSLDFWLFDDQGRWLIPSKLDQAEQHIELEGNLHVISQFTDGDWRLKLDVSLELFEGQPACRVQATATASSEVRLAVVVRPYNPEGISFIDSIRATPDCREWTVNKSDRVVFNRPPDKCFFSNYREGDVAHLIKSESGSEARETVCPVSMASGAAIFPSAGTSTAPLEVRVPLVDEITRKPVSAAGRTVPGWTEELAKCSRLKIPDGWLQELYDIAVAGVILHAPGEVYPGPYTYKRFWYRDAAFILNALITLGARERTRRALDLFPRGQTIGGYFRSQEGEWDSNGQVLWILHRYLTLTGESAPEEWRTPIEKGARWIQHKRLPVDAGVPHGGLLPAGFSAEHLGPNDYYYWDDFWGVAGLRAAATMPGMPESHQESRATFAAWADEFWRTILASFRFIPERRSKGAISASPHRRMDAGAIGSVVADYPLQLFPPGEERMMKTVGFLMDHSWYDGGFFQDMIHSGINAYLTLHLAQVLLRAGDLRALQLVDTVARLATSTGQWPEAIHPRTLGGCMGDGQHIWAGAEWALMIRNLFVREESDQLILGSGLFPRWLKAGKPLSFGPTLTPFGPVSVEFEPEDDGGYALCIEADWRGRAPRLEARVPGYTAAGPIKGLGRFHLRRDS